MAVTATNKRSFEQPAIQPSLLSRQINQFTFFYDPHEIIFDDALLEYLSAFRTDDGENSFVLTRDEYGYVIY